MNNESAIEQLRKARLAATTESIQMEKKAISQINSFIEQNTISIFKKYLIVLEKMAIGTKETHISARFYCSDYNVKQRLYNQMGLPVDSRAWDYISNREGLYTVYYLDVYDNRKYIVFDLDRLFGMAESQGLICDWLIYPASNKKNNSDYYFTIGADLSMKPQTPESLPRGPKR